MSYTMEDMSKKYLISYTDIKLHTNGFNVWTAKKMMLGIYKRFVY